MHPVRRHYSGVLVSAEPTRFEETLGALSALPDVEVRQLDAPTARCVVVLESADRQGQERLFRAISALPGVRAAELAFHWIDADAAAPVAGNPPCEEEAS